MEATQIAQRIKTLIAESRLSVRAFALKCGILPTTLDMQLKGQRSVSLATVSAILSTFPDLSAQWMMRGEGEILMSNDAPPKNAGFLDTSSDTIAMLQEVIDDKNELIAKLREYLSTHEAKA